MGGLPLYHIYIDIQKWKTTIKICGGQGCLSRNHLASLGLVLLPLCLCLLTLLTPGQQAPPLLPLWSSIMGAVTGGACQFLWMTTLSILVKTSYTCSSFSIYAFMQLRSSLLLPGIQLSTWMWLPMADSMWALSLLMSKCTFV